MQCLLLERRKATTANSKKVQNVVAKEVWMCIMRIPQLRQRMAQRFDKGKPLVESSLTTYQAMRVGACEIVRHKELSFVSNLTIHVEVFGRGM
jgi:hypothetical protein